MKFDVRSTLIPIFALMALLLNHPAHSDGVVVDKIYHPYIEAMEQEIEWRSVWQDQQPGQENNRVLSRLAYGRSFGDRWFGEAYLVFAESTERSLELEGYELEVRHQLTEQGQYWADWGVIMELEKEDGADIWEFSSGLIVEKELGRWSATANALVIQEWGSDIDDELESTLALQTRYRFKPYLEPALEFHSGQDTRAFGPAMQGNLRLGVRRNLHWEMGLLFGLDSESPDTSIRAGLEYEF